MRCAVRAAKTAGGRRRRRPRSCSTLTSELPCSERETTSGSYRDSLKVAKCLSPLRCSDGCSETTCIECRSRRSSSSAGLGLVWSARIPPARRPPSVCFTRARRPHVGIGLGAHDVQATTIPRVTCRFSSDHRSQNASGANSTWTGDRLGTPRAVASSLLFVLLPPHSFSEPPRSPSSAGLGFAWAARIPPATRRFSFSAGCSETTPYASHSHLPAAQFPGNASNASRAVRPAGPGWLSVAGAEIDDSHLSFRGFDCGASLASETDTYIRTCVHTCRGTRDETQAAGWLAGWLSHILKATIN